MKSPLACHYSVDPKNSRYKFSLDKEAAIACIRKLADLLESGECLIQTVETSQKADIDDYLMSKTVIEIIYAEKIE